MKRRQFATTVYTSHQRHSFLGQTLSMLINDHTPLPWQNNLNYFGGTMTCILCTSYQQWSFNFRHSTISLLGHWFFNFHQSMIGLTLLCSPIMLSIYTILYKILWWSMVCGGNKVLNHDHCILPKANQDIWLASLVDYCCFFLCDKRRRSCCSHVLAICVWNSLFTGILANIHTVSLFTHWLVMYAWLVKRRIVCPD